MLLRVSENLAREGHPSPLNGATQLLWSTLSDFSEEDLDRVRRRRAERAEEPDTAEWS